MKKWNFVACVVHTTHACIFSSCVNVSLPLRYVMLAILYFLLSAVVNLCCIVLLPTFKLTETCFSIISRWFQGIVVIMCVACDGCECVVIASLCTFLHTINSLHLVTFNSIFISILLYFQFNFTSFCCLLFTYKHIFLQYPH